jgi:hypothetical protein
MSTTADNANTPVEPKPDTQCGDGMVYDAELGECVPKADSDVVGGGAASGAEKSISGMLGAVKSIFEDLVDQKFAEMEKQFDQRMNATIDRLQRDFASGLRKELGLSTDPSVKKSELESAIRKAVLDLKLTGKRTPASPSMDAPLQKAQKPGDIFASYGAQ